MASDEKRLDLPRIDREIGDHEYRCSRLLLGHWIELEVLIIGILGSQVLDLDEKNLGAYAPKILGGASVRDHELLMVLLGRALQVRTDRGSWSQLTRDKQQRWWPMHIRELGAVIALFFEVQFSDFFEGLSLLSAPAAEELDDHDGKASQR